MASSVNKSIIIGNVGKAPEIRAFQNGGRVASFSLATSDTWKDKATGERKERTEWHRISVMNDALVTIVERYLKKGAKVYVEGQLETRKWTDKEGQERFVTEIVLRPYRGELTILSPVGNGEDSGSGGQLPNNDVYGAVPERPAASPVIDLDDDIPF